MASSDISLSNHFPSGTDSAAPRKHGPHIYYILGDDEPTRGDSHGYAGIGRTMAEKLDGTFFQIDGENLAKLYPEEPSEYDRERKFLHDYGTADIVICRSRYTTGPYTDNDTIFIEGRNENLGTKLEKDMLVAHHVTPELLACEGQKFRAHYKDDIQGTLIAFLLVENIACTKLLGQALVRQALQDDQATIFLTTCWRTSEDDYEKIMQGCREAIKAANAEDRIKLVNYHLNEEKRNGSAYNPYVGLLDQSDHIILWGRSHSMFSEAAATGKTVHVSGIGYDNGGYKHLEGQGVVRHYDFETASLETEKSVAVNKTVEVAEAMIDNNAYCLRKKGFLPYKYDRYAQYETAKAAGAPCPAP